ncbi:hypothetical protein [Vreelandella aquamarina]|uniref:hypothetical protein n=1 Tax=Vreelandella aquamarina TaxID=77097 RepID=UPI00078333E8|nr:hypothetical protein [Halomonas axialensis]
MSEEVPRWPDSLPLPAKVTFGPRRVHLLPADFESEGAISDILHDLYWFRDDQYYLFYSDTLKLTSEVAREFEASGVVFTEIESYFYMHPKPGYERDFIQALPNGDYPAWRQEAANGEMFCRASLALDSAMRREMDFNESAARTRDAITDTEDVVDLKPNFFGIGLNLNSAWRRFLTWFKSR